MDFRQALDAHIRGQTGLEDVARVLQESLQRQAGLAASHGALIEAVYRLQRLSGDSYTELMRVVSSFQAPPAPVTQAARSAPADSDATILRGARPQRPNADPDKTRFRLPPASEATGRDTTGASSWSDPARWLPTSSEPLGPGSVLKERFVLEQKIGHGGMGTVYKARDRRKDEAQDRNPYVAIKVLNEDFKRHPRSLQALQREARKAQALAHPNIVTVYDFDRDGTNVFMVMELLDGEPLDALIRRHKGVGLDAAKAWHVALELCKGMSYAHERGIVHADFKPANAFLLADGSVKIFDFGIARAVKRGSRAEGVATVFDPGTLGALTPAYASRDVALGLEPEASDDVYAIACVIYELLTGSHPFNRVSADVAATKGMKPARPAGVPWRRWWALRRALEFGRERRPATARVLLDTLSLSASPRAPLLYASMAVAAVAIVVVGVALFRSHLMAKDEADVAAALVSGDSARVEEVLPDLRDLAADRRAAIFLDEGARAGLIRYFEGAMEAATDAARGRYDYPRAESLLADLMSFFADSQAVRDIADRLSARKSAELRRQIDALEASLRNGVFLVRQGEPNVTSTLSIIKAIDPSHPVLIDARLPAAFATQARAAFERGDVDLAKDLVAAGTAADPGDRALLALADEIGATRRAASSEQRAGGRADGARGALGSSQGVTRSQAANSGFATELGSGGRRAGGLTSSVADSGEPTRPEDMSVEQLRARLTAGIAAPGRTIANTRLLAAVAAEMERRGAPDAAELKRTLKLRLARDIAAIRARKGVDEASRFAESAYALFPDSQVLKKSLTDLRLAAAEGAARRREADLAQVRTNLAALLDARRLDDAWPAAVEGELQRLGGFVAPDDPYFVDVRRGVAALYLTRAMMMREATRMTESQRMLDKARSYGAAPAAIAAEEKLFAQALARLETDIAERERVARIEALKQKVLAQAQANDVDGATGTLKELRGALPKQDKFLTEQAPAAMALAYVRMASGAARELRLRDAIELLERGKRLSRNAADYSRLRSRYLRYSDIVKDVSEGPVLNVERISRDLAAFAAQDFEEENAVARGIVQKLVNRSNTSRDQELASRLSGIARLLNEQQAALRKEQAERQTS